MSEHTPGPWIFKDGSVYVDRMHGVCVALPHTLPGQAAAAISGDWTKYGILSATEEANARLIAAAPDMLEALQELVEFLDDQADADDGIPNNAMRHLVEVTAAIIKATGGAS